MKERPILFSAPMVRAILSGQKTQTRRIMKPQPDTRTTRVSVCHDQWMGTGPSGCGVGTAQWDSWQRSPFAEGDRLWVRETWAEFIDTDFIEGRCIELGRNPVYRADGEDQQRHTSWRPSIHMPRRASRILLQITGVRVERLNDINGLDAIAEGLVDLGIEGARWHWDPKAKEGHFAPWRAYRALWEQINGPGSWKANPWVWVIEFRRIEA
jgi:hypothetical protein